MSYLVAIKTAIALFPLIALLFTIPFILHQYHKYGSINKFRCLIIYSFILYLITIYFLVILPLPNREDVVYKENMIRLVPFSFITDFLNESSFIISEPSTYLKALTEPCFYTVALNIIMTIPFGIYLRYYFNCGLKKTILLTFLLSLFFEITQVTGLYYIYKYQYRVFDVDDLITNVLGGVLGYFVGGLANKFLPTRKQIDSDSLLKGQFVSGFRRISLFCLDTCLCFTMSIILWRITDKKIMILLGLVIYYIIVPVFLKSQTLGGKFLNVRIEYNRYGFLKGIMRVIFLYFYYLEFPLLILRITTILITILNIKTHTSIIIYLCLFIGIVMFILTNVIHLSKNNRIFYDNLFKVAFVSTIKNN